MTTIAHNPMDVAKLTLQTPGLAYSASTRNRSSLTGACLDVLEIAGIVPHLVRARVRDDVAELSICVDSDERTIMRARALLEVSENLAFEPSTPMVVERPSDQTTARLRLLAEHRFFGPNAYLLISRGSSWEGDVSQAASKAVRELEIHGREYAEACKPGRSGSLRRLLTALRAHNADVLWLDGAAQWGASGTQDSGVDCVFRLEAKEAAELRSSVIRGALKRVLSCTGGRLVTFSDLDNQD